MALQKKIVLTGLYSFIIIGSASFYATQKNEFITNPAVHVLPAVNIAKGKPIDASPTQLITKTQIPQGQKVAIEEAPLP
jgi:hypothetical protein